MSDFTPEQVDRAAEQLSKAVRDIDWAELSEWSKEFYREDARAVLSAAGVPEELAHLRAGLEHVSGRMAEARATLQYFADRIDEHVFGELSSELDDQWCDFETGMPLGAPEKVAPVVDEAALAEVIHRAACGHECKDESPMRVDYAVARVVAAYLRGESK